MKKNGFELRKEKKMRDIEEATLTLLNQRELADITTDEIAKSAKVSKVTLFNYYDTKNNLINTTIFNSFQIIIDEYEKLIASDLSFEETYKTFATYKLRQINQSTPLFFQNVMTQFASDPSFYNQDTQGITTRLLMKMVEKGRSEGQINPNYSDEVIMMYMNIFTEGMKNPILKSDDLLKYATQITQMFLNSLK